MKKRAAPFLIVLALVIAAQSAEVLQEITVKNGDTLWSIANEYLKDPNRWPEVLKYNQLPMNDPAAALPGMKLKVPILLIKEHLRKASLVLLLNDVRYRKKDQTAWKSAVKNMELYNEDGLRTMENSRAEVKFYSGDILKLDENSLAILRPELKVEEASLMSGAIRSSRTKVITPTAQVMPQSKDTVYKARIRPDKATIVQVEKGSAEVLGLDTGKKMVVQAGFANITLPKMAPSVPVKVPQLPDFKVPEFTMKGDIVLPNGEVKASSGKELSPTQMEVKVPETSAASVRAPEKEDFTPKETDLEPKLKNIKSWKDYREYKLIIAKDPKFSQVLWEKRQTLESRRFITDSKEYNLPDGKYYRGISYFDESGRESEIFMLGAFEIDTVPPKVNITFPPDGYQSREVLVNVEGQTEANCSLTINNYSVPVGSDGKFSWALILANEGSNKIKVVARDHVGNKTEFERVIYLKGGGRGE